MKIYAMALVMTALAANIIVASPALGADAAAVPVEATQGNVSFISGGVGEDEAAMMKSVAAQYPLALQFVQKAVPRDEFLADVKVVIRDRSKNVVLDAVSKGPFLLAKLPAGSYQVEASYYGVTKRQNVDVRPSKRERATFVWAAQSDDPALISSSAQ